MHFTHLICASAFALGSMAFETMSHGAVDDYNGGQIKWQQFAKDVWAGIPIDEWNETIHTRSDEDVLLDHLAPRNTDLDLETRNFRQYCQAVSNCATSTGYHRLEGCLEALSGAMTAVARSRDAARSLWNVLNDTPIVTSCAGSFIGGVLAAKAVESPGKNDPAECSTSRSNKDADVLLSAMTAGLAHDSGASSVSIEVVGESSHYIITITSSDKSSQARHPTCKN